MTCPWCNKDGRFKTVDTRHRWWGVKRVKVCPSCGKHVATIEVCQITTQAIESLEISQSLIDYKEYERNIK